MVQLQAGSFTMGSPTYEVGRAPSESNHAVTLTRDFRMGVTEVSQKLFEDTMGYQPSCTPGCAECPVTCMSWHEAAAFTNALSGAWDLRECYRCTGTGADIRCHLDDALPSPYACDGYRLPTEAEWEYGARAGTRTAYSNGADLLPGDEYTCGDVILSNGAHLADVAIFCGEFLEEAAPAGTRDANPWGLYDMHGNAWEWCQDAWEEGDYQGDATDPWGLASATWRVFRGGSWFDEPLLLRSANRRWGEPTGGDMSLGFRVVRTASGGGASR